MIRPENFVHHEPAIKDRKPLLPKPNFYLPKLSVCVPDDSVSVQMFPLKDGKRDGQRTDVQVMMLYLR